jgi:hypothetical protein
VEPKLGGDLDSDACSGEEGWPSGKDLFLGVWDRNAFLLHFTSGYACLEYCDRLLWDLLSFFLGVVLFVLAWTCYRVKVVGEQIHGLQSYKPSKAQESRLRQRNSAPKSGKG